MLGIPLRYLLKHPLAATDLLTDPAETWTRIVDAYVAEREQREPACSYEPDLDWEQQLHQRLDLPWPCDATRGLSDLWRQVMEELEAKGIRPGPESFGSWNDGDAGFVRAIWCLTRHLKPTNVLETGVAHGVTSRFILEALDRNDSGRNESGRNVSGHLWSIDLPPLERAWREQVGAAVGPRFRDRWTYLEGSSRRQLPGLLSRLGQIDLFIHDSLHSERNVRFELDRAWRALKPGGVLVVDDVDANWGFRTFDHSFPGHQSLICEAEPIRPDARRFNKKGLFGIIFKDRTLLSQAA
jgi:hypothetical protein